ncbi:lectin-like domain-containing protein [Lactococcus allomyrinae]|uniref:lectin-like domain-containing protein n=1 Tax=Lactococcus allomyrinae TaxID=2419773 RepID=UPI001F091251|nr:hypothetical protein [Lactococcus allomyrinae]
MNNISYKVVQADTTTSQLVPGQSTDTGNHIYPLNANTNSALWTNVGTAQTNSTSPFSVSLVNNQSTAAGYALFNGAIDMSQRVSFSGMFSLRAHSGTNPFAAGDSLGFILTPKSTDFIANNLQTNVAADGTSNVVGKYLGIGGLPDSIFVGRDLYQNSDVDLDGAGTENAASNNIAIRQTNSSGTLITKDYATASAPDSGATVTDNMEIEWQPTSVSTNESTVTGVLTYTISSASGVTLSVLTETLSVARSMSLGVIGATGGNYGILSYSSTSDDFNAYKGTQNVQVNYLDQETGQSIINTLPSTIIANVGDKLTVFGKQLRDVVDVNTYSYLAPEISGYMFVSANPMIVANNDLVNNVINVYYKKIPIGKAHFSYQYNSDVTDRSIALPSIDDTQGEVNTAVIMPKLTNLPVDYFVSKVMTADGQQYATLEDALADAKYTNEDLQFTLIVSKVSAPETSDKGSNEVNPKKDINNEQAEQKPKTSATVVVPKKKQSTKEKSTKQNNEVKSKSKDIKLPLTPPLAPSSLKPELPRSSDAIAIKKLVEQSEASAHNLKVKVAGTAGLFAGGAVAFGTLTGLGKFAKLWKILKK